MSKYCTTSSGILKIKDIEVFLGGDIERYRRLKNYDFIVGWGHKRSGVESRSISKRQKISSLTLEDGFISFWGKNKDHRLSIVIDPIGIYYDSTCASKLENILNSISLDSQQCRRSENLINRLLKYQITKYNRPINDNTLKLPEKYVLVVDQSFGDQSILHGYADDSSFTKMLDTAIAENPDVPIVLKLHPDSIRAKKTGYFKEPANHIIICDINVNPHLLISKAVKIYTVTSQLGFEALLHDKLVVCFGSPFYSGWGLTDDRGFKIDRRQRNLSIAELAYASLIEYPTYVDPTQRCICAVEDVVYWLESRVKIPENILAVGFSPWKRSFIPKFLGVSKSDVRFKNRGYATRSKVVVCWGAENSEYLRKKVNRVITIEDGFIRSVGLGSDLKRPSSLVIDDKGIYYDATRGSRLEDILNSISLDSKMYTRSAQIINSLNSSITKYNVGAPLEQESRALILGAKSRSRPIILIAGQLESDASIKYGSPNVKNNCDLIERVRCDFSSAFLVYKPHPDVVSRNKGELYELEFASKLCDLIVKNVDIGYLYPMVDRVCTITSLAGFEALIRGIKVTVYGMPFYSGWGLTDDKMSCERRVKSLSIAELVYGVLVAYPTYIDWSSGQLVCVEKIIKNIDGKKSSIGSNPFVRTFRKCIYFFQTWLN